MEGALHRFVRLLRLFGVRVSVAEAADAMLAAAQPGVLADRQTLRAALRVTLIKDRRDDELFDELFAAFFSLRPVAGRPASTVTAMLTTTWPTRANWSRSRFPKSHRSSLSRGTAMASRRT